ncbi:hypothetical protein PsorP6_006564 [Peronosclerospora sorghi]|uniref:Uncharacterized protein n=1 Tax=Peronosclerospora sorghi TaxID=230839 RepID=A0ACC0W4B2_9STRA|nr:hypothetical protein PsorP6_006564 [Peronosclerospora sorghi]
MRSYYKPPASCSSKNTSFRIGNTTVANVMPWNKPQSVKQADQTSRQKRPTSVMQQNPPAETILLPTAASPLDTSSLHSPLVEGASEATAVSREIVVVVGSVIMVVALNSEQPTNAVDFGVSFTLQKRQWSLKQPRPSNRHVASSIAVIPTTASP